MTVVARLAVTLGTMVMLAVAWSPSEFGFFVTALSVSVVVGLFTNYGFVMFTLREIGADVGRAGTLISSSFVAKTWMSMAALVVACGYLFFASGWPPQYAYSFLVILVGSLVASYGDLALSAFRGLGLYDAETKIVVTTSVIHVAAIGIAALLGCGLFEISFVYALSRALYTAVVVRRLSKQIHLNFAQSSEPGALGSLFRRSSPFALDALLVNAGSQLEGILVAYLLDMHNAGLFQAGYRISQAAIPFGAVLASLHIPRFSALLAKNDPGAGRYGAKLIGEFAGLGVIFGAGIALFGPIYSATLLGAEYDGLIGLWTGLGVFTGVRFLASGLGAHLIVSHNSYWRPVGLLVSLTFTVAIFVLFLQSGGLALAPWLATAGATSLVCAYVVVLVTSANTKDRGA